MVLEIKAAAKVGDSLGGIVEVIAYGVRWDSAATCTGIATRRTTRRRTHEHSGGEGGRDWGRILPGLPARQCRARRHRRGRLVRPGGGYIRRTDHAGGTEGGISSGAPIIAKVAMKPLSTLNRPVLETVDVVTRESAVSFKERTDVTAVPALVS